MAKLENVFKKYLVKIMGTRWDVQSHEDMYSEGIPDLSFGVNGVGGWIELKQIEKWPKTSSTLAKPKKYTKQQINWIIKRGKKGGHCYVAVKIVETDEYFLFTFREAKRIASGMTKEDFYPYSIGNWKRTIVVSEFLDLISGN